jgi:predicted nucleic acid-binding protein
VSGFLIDTNVISEFVRPRPNAHVISWLEAIEPAMLFASVVTFGEIRLGIEDMPLSKRRSELEEWLEKGMPAWFESNLLPITKAIADRWGQITIQAKRKGTPLSTADGFIAATALVHGLVVVTRDVSGFGQTGAGLVNPWEP